MASLQVEKAQISTKDLKQPQIGAQATMRNVTPTDMSLTRSISWFGTPSGGRFPATIPANGLARFDHLRGNDPRSKGAVVYSGRNRAGSPCSWILAWDAAARTSVSPNKVYIACGLASTIEKMDFNQIQRSLDKSTAEVNVTDTPSKTNGFGNIQHLIPNTAFIGSDFGLMP